MQVQEATGLRGATPLEATLRNGRPLAALSTLLGNATDAGVVMGLPREASPDGSKVLSRGDEPPIMGRSATAVMQLSASQAAELLAAAQQVAYACYSNNQVCYVDRSTEATGHGQDEHNCFGWPRLQSEHVHDVFSRPVPYLVTTLSGMAIWTHC